MVHLNWCPKCLSTMKNVKAACPLIHDTDTTQDVIDLLSSHLVDPGRINRHFMKQMCNLPVCKRAMCSYAHNEREMFMGAAIVEFQSRTRTQSQLPPPGLAKLNPMNDPPMKKVTTDTRVPPHYGEWSLSVSSRVIQPPKSKVLAIQSETQIQSRSVPHSPVNEGRRVGMTPLGPGLRRSRSSPSLSPSSPSAQLRNIHLREVTVRPFHSLITQNHHTQPTTINAGIGMPPDNVKECKRVLERLLKSDMDLLTPRELIRLDRILVRSFMMVREAVNKCVTSGLPRRT